jgi:hypothetical protein
MEVKEAEKKAKRDAKKVEKESKHNLSLFMGE